MGSINVSHQLVNKLLYKSDLAERIQIAAISIYSKTRTSPRDVCPEGEGLRSSLWCADQTRGFEVSLFLPLFPLWAISETDMFQRRQNVPLRPDDGRVVLVQLNFLIRQAWMQLGVCVDDPQGA